jgi:hypothetical protein
LPVLIYYVTIQPNQKPMDEKNIIKINNGISLMGSIMNHIEIYVEELVLILDESEDDIRDEKN